MIATVTALLAKVPSKVWLLLAGAAVILSALSLSIYLYGDSEYRRGSAERNTHWQGVIDSMKANARYDTSYVDVDIPPATIVSKPKPGKPRPVDLNIQQTIDSLRRASERDQSARDSIADLAGYLATPYDVRYEDSVRTEIIEVDPTHKTAVPNLMLKPRTVTVPWVTKTLTVDAPPEPWYRNDLVIAGAGIAVGTAVTELVPGSNGRKIGYGLAAGFVTLGILKVAL